MRKEILEQQQPVVFRAMYNALKDNRVANAYLFTGPETPAKKDAAVLFAQSLLCTEGNVFGCESCNICSRIQENIHPDVIILDGKEKAVSKNDVDDIQSRFSKTALEGGNGRKVYIILNLENASPAAMNSLLKFLEEPASGVTAVLTTDNLSRILPTIISRCTVLPFRPMKQEDRYALALQAGVPEEDAYFVSCVCTDPAAMKDVAGSDIYERALRMFRQYLNLEALRDELLIDYDISWRFKEKEKNISLLSIFFTLLTVYARDVILHDEKGPSWYYGAVRSSGMTPARCAEIIRIASEQKDKCSRYNDLNLVMYQAVYRLEEQQDEHSI